MANSIAPGYARVTYDGSRFPHHQTLPVRWAVDPEPGFEPTLLTRGGDPVLASVGIADYVTQLLPIIPENRFVSLVEFHSYDADTETDSFIWSTAIGVEGTQGTIPPSAAGQAVMTMKTALGNPFRFYIMEGAYTIGVRDLPPFALPEYNDMAIWLQSTDCWVWGRDGREIFAPVSFRTKINDKLRESLGL